MKKENLLIVCFDIKDFKKINKIDLSNYEKVVVASDDYRVHEVCRRLDFINGVTFLQNPIPYTKVADEVIKFIERINNYYGEVAKKNKIYEKKIMEWPFHVEGGQYTQVIQTLFLHIENIESIVKSKKINNIYLLENNQYTFIADVIEEYCYAKQITLKKKKKIIFVKHIDVKEMIRPYYYLLKTIYIKLLFKHQKNKKNSNVGLFWFFTNNKKHLDNALFIDKLLKKSNYESLAYSWRISKVEEESINLHRIEQYVSWKEIFISIYKTVSVLFYKDAIYKSCNKYTFVYNDKIELSKFIKPLVFKYLLVEAPDSYRFYKGFRRFSNSLSISLIAGNLNSQKIGNIVESILPMNDLKKFAMSTFLTGKNIYDEYRLKLYLKSYWENFYYFVQNEIEKNRLLKEINIDSNKIIIYGSNRISTKIELTKKEIFHSLNIDTRYKYYILLDFPNYLFGYQSISEVVTTFHFFLEKFKENNEICLLIKPHPSADMRLFKILKNNYSCANIYFLKKTDNVDYALSVADIVVTKYSTLGIEAVKYKTIVISTQFDKSEYFKLYGDFASYVYNVKELEELLDNILESSYTLKIYTDNFVKKTEKYIKDYYIPLNESIIINNIEKE